MWKVATFATTSTNLSNQVSNFPSHHKIKKIPQFFHEILAKLGNQTLYSELSNCNAFKNNFTYFILSDRHNEFINFFSLLNNFSKTGVA